jgi:hypothetical protein
MAISYDDTTRSNRMTQVVNAIGSAGSLLIYTGSEPAKTSAPTGTLLATFALADPAGTVSDGVLTFTLPANVSAVASGTPGWFRMIDGSVDDGTHTHVQGSAGVGSGDLDFGSAISGGGVVSITSMTITEGND